LRVFSFDECMTIKQYLWILPFCSFLLGYYFLPLFFPHTPIQTPSLIGKSLYQALSIISPINLNIRILGEKEDYDLPDGTILYQAPHIGEKIKQNQAIFVVISKKPLHILAPSLLYKHVSVIEKETTEQNIPIKLWYVPSIRPSATCIAQFPCPQNPLKTDQSVIAYIAQNIEKPIICPDFRGKTIGIVKEFLEKYDIELDIIQSLFSNNSYDNNAIIINQRPIAGSLILITESQKPRIQLQIN
jgi:beta-lactam-binding protein with PASTA domain